MAGKAKTIEEAMRNTAIEAVNESDLENIIQEIVEKNQDIIKNQKERAVGPLMGIAMKELRGKASGEMINNLLLKNIKKKLASI
jgi:glutamyl-tRNA(Gln) amidotransferase subunit E